MLRPLGTSQLCILSCRVRRTCLPPRVLPHRDKQQGLALQAAEQMWGSLWASWPL